VESFALMESFGEKLMLLALGLGERGFLFSKHILTIFCFDDCRKLK